MATPSPVNPVLKAPDLCASERKFTEGFLVRLLMTRVSGIKEKLCQPNIALASGKSGIWGFWHRQLLLTHSLRRYGQPWPFRQRRAYFALLRSRMHTDPDNLPSFADKCSFGNCSSDLSA